MLDLLGIVTRLAAMVEEFEFLFGALCLALGLVFVVRGLMAAARRSERGPGGGGWSGAIMMFATGALFFGFPALVGTLTKTVFGLSAPPDAEAIFSFAPDTLGGVDSDGLRGVIVAVTVIIQFVGLIAIARGLWLVNLSAQGERGAGAFGPGLTFMIAGALAVNFPAFVGVMERLLVTPSGGL